MCNFRFIPNNSFCEAISCITLIISYTIFHFKDELLILIIAYKAFRRAQEYAKHDISVLYSYSQIVIENISRDAIENSLIFSNPKLPTT